MFQILFFSAIHLENLDLLASGRCRADGVNERIAHRACEGAHQ